MLCVSGLLVSTWVLCQQSPGDSVSEEKQEDAEEASAAALRPLPGGRRRDVAGEGAAGAGGLSLPGQEGLTRARVGQPVFSRHLLQGHALKEMDALVRARPRGQPRPQGHSLTDAKLISSVSEGPCTMLYQADTIIFSS